MLTNEEIKKLVAVKVGGFLNSTNEKTIKHYAWRLRIPLVYIATESGQVKDILQLEPYGKNEENILKAVSRINNEVRIFTHNGFKGYTDYLTRRLYERNKDIIVTVDGEIMDEDTMEWWK